MQKWFTALFMLTLLSCREGPDQTKEVLIVDSLSKISRHTLKDTVIEAGIPVKTDSFITDNTRTKNIPILPSELQKNTGTTTPDELMKYAETLIGIPYVYASTNPHVGFDCSGFITYVFTHFKIEVPRSSIDFTNLGQTVPIVNAKRGDFILFTGTSTDEVSVGHMGLIVSNTANGITFIHATSGRAMSVTITELNEQYKKRFVRISRIFPQNE